VLSVIDCAARMLPTNPVFEPSVAELATRQKTLHGWAPLISRILLADAVIRVEAA
jgi:hypothetical protein